MRVAGVLAGLTLCALAVAAALVAVYLWPFLAGSPSPDEGDTCLGGQTGAAVVFVASGLIGLTAGVWLIVQVVRARSGWLPLAVWVAAAVMWIGVPIYLQWSNDVV